MLCHVLTTAAIRVCVNGWFMQHNYSYALPLLPSLQWLVVEVDYSRVCVR